MQQLTAPQLLVLNITEKLTLCEFALTSPYLKTKNLVLEFKDQSTL